MSVTVYRVYILPALVLFCTFNTHVFNSSGLWSSVIYIDLNCQFIAQKAASI